MDLRERIVDTPRHPWEVSRARCFRRIIRAHAGSPRRVIDVGSGDGWFAEQLLADLPRDAHIECWDVGYTAEDLAEPTDPRIHRTASAPRTPAPLVLALDVLEHVDDDVAFVHTELLPLVTPGGTLVASVPAHQALFTRHDTALGHARRHSAASLRALLTPAFDIVEEGSLFTTLLAPRAVQKAVELVRRPTTPPQVESRWHHGPGLTRAVTAVLDADAALGRATAGRRWRPPGLSVWAVARRPA